MEFVDASLFLGMHSVDEPTRIACKNYFVDRFECSLGMSDDQAGYCDRIIWQYSRALQDIYYPFMDRLRTDMDIQGLAYTQDDIDAVRQCDVLSSLKLSQQLTVAMAIARDGKLYTVDPELHRVNVGLLPGRQIPVYLPSASIEKSFPDVIIEACYQDSLALKI